MKAGKAPGAYLTAPATHLRRRYRLHVIPSDGPTKVLSCAGSTIELQRERGEGPLAHDNWAA